MILKAIGYVRKLSPQARDRIALGLASVFTLVVASAWGFSELHSSLEQIESNVDQGAFSTLVSGLTDQFASVMNTLGDSSASNDVATTTLEQTSSSLETLVDSYTQSASSAPTQDMVPTAPVQRSVQIEAVSRATTSTSSTPTAE